MGFAGLLCELTSPPGMPNDDVMDVAQLRREYSERGLDRGDLSGDPIEQFAHWLKEAHDAGVIEPNAMSLATADDRCRPHVRTLLLKAFDERGFTFFTNYASRKGCDLQANPHASMVFPWLLLERQVIVTGSVSRVDREESLKYFQSRPLGSRLGAWASAQSSEVDSREALERSMAEVRERFGDQDIPLPDCWGGYRLRPVTVEFWQGRASRLHDRFEFRRTENGWDVVRLSP